MNNKPDEEPESVKEIILNYIQHNPRHYIKLKIKGKEFYPCARCFGLWTGFLVGFILSSPFWRGFIYTDNFILVFTVAWLFVIPTIVDWSTIKLGLRKGNNGIRVATGFLYGFGIIVYLFVLPANIIFKIVTYLIYEAIFYLIRRRYKLFHYRSR